MIALGGPTLKLQDPDFVAANSAVSMIALGGPTLKRLPCLMHDSAHLGFNDSTGRAYTETALAPEA